MAAYMAMRRTRICNFGPGRGPVSMCLSRLRHQHSNLVSVNKTEPAEVPTINVKGINIPKKVKRTPTTVLEALASTVSYGNNISDANLIDDPNISQQNTPRVHGQMILHKSLGIKAAQHMIKTNWKYLQHNPAEPHIEAFMPEKPFTHKEPCEEGLLERVRGRKVAEAIKMYEEIEQNGIALQPSTMEDLLELVCVYNHQDPKEEHLPDLKFYINEIQLSTIDRRGNMPVKREQVEKNYVPVWPESSVADQIFQKMSPRSPRAYSAMIGGMSKFPNKYQDTLALYQEMKAKNMPATEQDIIRLISNYNNFQDFWSTTMGLLSDIASQGKKPTTDIFNSILMKLAINFSKQHTTINMLLKVTAEMKRVETVRTLRTYYYTLKAFSKHSIASLKLFEEILDEVEQQDLIVRHPVDAKFIAFAMEVACKLKNGNAVARVNNLVLRSANFNLFQTSLDLQTYKNALLNFLLNRDIDFLMENFAPLVPHICVPTGHQIGDIIALAETQSAYHYIPTLWKWVMLLRAISQEMRDGDTALLTRLLILMGTENVKEASDETRMALCRVIEGSLMKLYLESASTEEMPAFRFRLTSGMVGYVINFYLNIDETDKALDVLKNYFQLEKYPFPPNPQIMMQLLEKICKVTKQTEQALYVVTLISNVYHTMTVEAVEKVKESLDLTGDEREKLDTLLQRPAKLYQHEHK